MDSQSDGRHQGRLRRVIKEACEEAGLNMEDLTVLAEQTDPYRFDTKAGHRDGKWAADQLRRFYGPSKKAHWRGLHYALIMAKVKVRKPDTRKGDGEIFTNTTKNWEWLLDVAGKAAKWLGYIPFDRIVDQRNAAPIIHRKPSVVAGALVSVGNVELPDLGDIDPMVVAFGFEARQAFHFVIFCEKSSCEEILLPIAQVRDADLYIGQGEASDTFIYQIAKEAAEDGRPLIVFIVSDCDPSGRQMAVSIGRKLQAFHDLFFPSLRWELVHAAVTPEQVREFDLPETPLKEDEKRAARWKETFGVEQTEVDSLTTPEMIERGLLAQIMEAAFAPYIDETLANRVSRAKQRWDKAAQKAFDEQVDTELLDEIREEAEQKLEEFRETIDDIRSRFEEATSDVTLPQVVVPEPRTDIEMGGHGLVLLDDDWTTATRKLIAYKSYGKMTDDGDA
jgi:hypothetical protein